MELFATRHVCFMSLDYVQVLDNNLRLVVCDDVCTYV